MKKKGMYFRETTRQQRRLLFETYESTGSVKLACEKAHVSRQVFYDWKPRFDTEGYVGLEKSLSRAPHHTQKTPEAIAEQVITLKKEHPDYGKRRIAAELMKANNWRPVISPNTVMGILKEHGLYPVSTPSKKKYGLCCADSRKARTNSQH
jgi:transposase